MSSKIRVAVLGYGHLGKWHCQKVDDLPASELVVIIEKDEENRKIAKKKHPHANVVAEVEEVLADFDAAIIVTPTSSHFALAQILLNNGKHVFCEKPLCERDYQALKLQQLVESKGVKLQVGHSERFHEAWEIVKKDNSFFSSPFCVQMNRVAPFKGRATDVDVVQDLMIHDIDLLLYLFDESPRSLIAVGNKICTDKWDFACVTFKFASGSKAVLTVSRNHYKEQRDLTLTNSEGCLGVDLMNNQIHYARKSHLGGSKNEVVVKDYQKRDHLLLEQEAFYKAIENNSIPVVTGTDGANAIKLLNKVLESLETGQEISV